MKNRLIICDLDNTLYDWVGYFVPAFYSMVEEVVKVTGCNKEKLLDDFQIIHKKYNDSEHPFALLETDTVKSLFPQTPLSQVAKELDSAFHAFNTSRKNNLRLYKGVTETLELLSNENYTIVAHTESKLYSIMDRLTRLDIDKFFKRIYCRERSISTHPFPDIAKNTLKTYPLYKAIELSHHQRKPDPSVLKEICADEGFSTQDSIYIGDSIARDVFMANEAGACSVWAKYGAHHSRELYEKLVRITHWTNEDVQREKKLKEVTIDICANYTLREGFYELTNVLLS